MKTVASLYLVLITCLIGFSVTTQGQKKPEVWTEWSKKDAEKLLTSSPWAQTQVETDLTEMFYSPTSNRGGTNSAGRAQQGATNQEVTLSYHIRFFSARPIRQALARLFQLQRQPTAEQMQGLESFASAVPEKMFTLREKTALECSCRNTFRPEKTASGLALCFRDSYRSGRLLRTTPVRFAFTQSSPRQ
jgi:hypothetical protein